MVKKYCSEFLRYDRPSFKVCSLAYTSFHLYFLFTFFICGINNNQ